MKYINTRIIAFFLAIAFFFAFSSSHPTGRSGAPGDGLCSNCHNGGGGINGEIDVLGLPNEVVPGTVYDLTAELSVTSGSPVRGGFQVVALFDSNNNQAGNWSNPDGNSSLKTSGGRVYFGHQPAVNFSGNTEIEWEAQWQAPSTIDDVIFYMVGVLANGNGSTSGDRVVVNQLTTTVMAANDIEIDFTGISGVTCNGDSDGSATANVSGGTSPYSYQWSSGEQNQTAFNLLGGTASLTVTDDNGMTAVDMVTIPEPAEIAINPIIEEILCFGDSNGSIDLSPSGGTGNLDCFWDEFGADCFQEDLGAGLYDVTITDANGCVLEETVELFEPDALGVNVSTTNENGNSADGTASIAIFGGVPTYQIAWSVGQIDQGNTSTLVGLSAGTYSVTVTDDNGCSEVRSFQILGGACQLSVTSDIMDVSCAGGNDGAIGLLVTGATEPVTYAWSNGLNTRDIQDLTAGTYSVSIADADLCVDTLFNLVVQEPDSLGIDSLNIMNVLCAGDDNGSASFAIKGGTAPYSVSWSQGLVSDTIIMGIDTIINPADTIQMLNAGTYAFTITDNNACVYIDSIEIEVLDLEPPFVNPEQIVLFLDESGMVGPVEESMIQGEITDNCAIAAFEFEQRPFDCADLGLIRIPLVVFDSNGNSTASELDVIIEDVEEPFIDCNNDDIVVNTCDAVEYEDPLAFDNCEIVSIELQEGLPSGSTFPLGTTTVSYLAIDQSGNQDECSFDVTVQTDLSATFTVQDAGCSGNDGAITVDVTGGAPPYTISPSNLTDLTAGEYLIEIADNNGCFLSELVLVGQQGVDFEFEIIVVQPSCNDTEDGSIGVIINGEDPSDFEVMYGSDDDGQDLGSGFYAIEVTRLSTQCTVIQNVEIIAPDPLEFELFEVLIDSCTGSFDGIDYELNGGTPNYGISFLTNGNNLEIIVTDANDCQVTEFADIPVYEDVLTIEVSSVTASDSDSNTGSIDLDVTGGVQPYTFIWLDSAGNIISNDEDPTEIFADNYFVTVIDADGCVQGIGPITVPFTTSTDDLEENTLEIYPNPTVGLLRIESESWKPERIIIYNTSGVEILNQSFDRNNDLIDLSAYPAGLYMLKAISGQQQVTKPILKY